MFTLTIKSLNAKENLTIAFRETAENLANAYYECIDVYAVEIINASTGELVYYKTKG